MSNVAPAGYFGEIPVGEVKATPKVDLWLLVGIQPIGVTIVGADSGVGKTWLGYAKMLSVSDGIPLCGSLTACRQGTVIAYNGEDWAPTTKERVEALVIGARRKATLDSIDGFLVAENAHEIQLDDESCQTKLYEYFEATRPALVVWDTLSTFMMGDENDRGDCGVITRFLRKCHRELGVSSILQHHLSGEKKIRGSKELRGGVDTRLILEGSESAEKDQVIEFTCSGGGRFGWTLPWHFRLDVAGGVARASMSSAVMAQFRWTRRETGLSDSDHLPELDTTSAERRVLDYINKHGGAAATDIQTCGGSGSANKEATDALVKCGWLSEQRDGRLKLYHLTDVGGGSR